MSTIKADPHGAPTEQVRHHAGWEALAEIAPPAERGRAGVERPRACQRCAWADLLRSRTGTWCNKHEFATTARATCRAWTWPDTTITEE